jgi:hypothetical protein
LKAARYLDESETVEFGYVDAFMGENFVVTVLRGESAALAPMRAHADGLGDAVSGLQAAWVALANLQEQAIHPSAWKVDSPNFALWARSDVCKVSRSSSYE